MVVRGRCENSRRTPFRRTSQQAGRSSCRLQDLLWRRTPRERLSTLRASQQDIATWLAPGNLISSVINYIFFNDCVMSVVVLCESSLGYDDAKLVTCGLQLKKAIDSIEKQHDQFSQLSPDQFNPDIPITFTK
ncbi:hypothetical protein GE061_003535, partial [Apolygus lucorum]